MKYLSRSFRAALCVALMQEAEAATGVGGAAGEFANGPTSASGRIKVARKDYDAENGTFSITFADGASSEVQIDSLPSNIVRMLALHGLSQKLGDSYASVKGDVAEAKKRYEAVLTQLQAGEWKQAREGGEGGAKVTELAEAIARFKNAPIEKANAVVAKATDEQVKAWKANAKIKAIIAQIRAEKAAARAAEAEKKAGENAAGTEQADALADLDLDAVIATAE